MADKLRETALWLEWWGSLLEGPARLVDAGLAETKEESIPGRGSG